MRRPPLLHYQIHGEGPVVVLLHGFLGSSHYWKKVTDLVSRSYKVISLDLLGFGDSPKPKQSSYDYADHISSINATLNQLGVDEPFILVGHSMGSLIALRYATVHENQVRKLLLTNIPVMLGSREVRDTILKPNLISSLGLMPLTHRLAWRAFRMLYVLKILPSRTSNQSRQYIHYLFQHTHISRLRSFQRVIRDARVDFDLGVVNVKTKIIEGLDDKKIYLENLTKNIQLSPSIVLETVKTGHHIPYLFPEKVVEAIEDI